MGNNMQLTVIEYDAIMQAIEREKSVLREDGEQMMDTYSVEQRLDALDRVMWKITGNNIPF